MVWRVYPIRLPPSPANPPGGKSPGAHGAEIGSPSAVFALLGPAFEMGRATGGELWRRYLALLLDGLRATGRPALPVPAPPLEALAVIQKAGRPRG